jgi:hypothetical protein
MRIKKNNKEEEEEATTAIITTTRGLSFILLFLHSKKRLMFDLKIKQTNYSVSRAMKTQKKRKQR